MSGSCLNIFGSVQKLLEIRVIWIRNSRESLQVLDEIENWFSENGQDVLCALGNITLSDLPTSDSQAL